MGWKLLVMGIITLLVIAVDAYYYVGPRELVYTGTAPHHVSLLGGLGERVKLEHEGYHVIKVNNPEELKKAVSEMDVTRIIYQTGRNQFILFIDDYSKKAVYYYGRAFFKGDNVYVLKPLFWIIR